MAKGTGIGARVAHVASRVSNLELLFDLVFVFTITQVTEVLVEHPEWLGLGRALVLLAIVYYMYDGFIWLMNQTAPDTTAVRVVLIVAMALFLLVAAAIPAAFDRGRLVYGIGFLLIVLVHHTLFFLLGSERNVRGMLRIGPFNLLAALVIAAAGFLDESIAWVCYPAGVVIILIGTFTASRSAFPLSPAHLIERHGLLMIIALGESIVAVGAGIAHLELSPYPILFTVIAVGVVGGLWWVYFSGDDTVAERNFESEDERRGRARLGITAFFGDHLAMMFGLVIFAAGIHLTVEQPLEVPPFPDGAFLGGGVALFLLGSGLFRWELKLGGSRSRVIGCVAALAVAALALFLPTLIELVILLIVVAATCVATARAHARSVEA